ncbi:hydrolase, alpha/beta domain protein [Dictyocaulus viviparus]|uniref:sn-1-specific diacylglycerol lipase ABHD11 n=1 Tax=Dictyocaulus viviparus TaxID=29172 RepID=A0A0D8XLC0_DICVI|nr:hydrolase, alpha/beta domain protein [Dictyocaulus viviparus]
MSMSQLLLIFVRKFCVNRKLHCGSSVELAFNRYGDPDKDHQRIPLVICHGLLGHKQNWRSVAKTLHRRLRSTIYTLDLRNHGESPWNDAMSYEDMSCDVVKFLETISKQFDIAKFHILGHSMGGRVAMRLAIEPSWQNLIDRLIIEDISPRTYGNQFTASFRKYVKGMAAMDLRKSRKELLKEFEFIVPDLAIRQFLLLNLVPSEVANESRWRCNLEAIDKHLENILKFTLPSGSFNGATLFCYGQNSDYVKSDDRNYIKSIFPNVTFECISDAGHWVHSEQPVAFMDAVCRFLQ